jgi:hypothetical protein
VQCSTVQYSAVESVRGGVIYVRTNMLIIIHFLVCNFDSRFVLLNIFTILTMEMKIIMPVIQSSSLLINVLIQQPNVQLQS